MAQVLEAMLYRNAPASDISAAHRLLSTFGRYARHLVLPMLCGIGILALASHLLAPFLAPALLLSGESAIVKVILAPEMAAKKSEPILSASSCVAVETPSLHIPGQQEFDWRIRLVPDSAGAAWIAVKINEASILRQLPTRDMSMETLIEQAFPHPEGPVQRIVVVPTSSRRNPADRLGVRLMLFFIITATLVEAFKKPLRVVL